MSQLSLLIKPASSLCNMHCTYCFYKDEASRREQFHMGIMKHSTVDAIIDKTINMNVSAIHYCFQGGEPTLAGIDYFNYFISEVKKKNKDKEITYSIQTNGLDLDDAWFQLFKKHHFLVGVSLDGYIENHDSFRKDHLDEGTFQRILNNIKKMEEMKIEYNILTVLTHQLSKEPKRLFKFYLNHHLKYIQLIPCLPSLENIGALTPQDFGHFYKAFFDQWYQEYQKGNYISVTLFDQVIPMYLNVAPTLCGMLGRCHMQFVIEGDGKVYPCDFYALDDYCCGNINEDSLEVIMNHSKAKDFIHESNRPGNLCMSCKFYKMCFGYCKRMNGCLRDENYCGYKEFLEYTQSRMIEIIKNIH